MTLLLWYLCGTKPRKVKQNNLRAINSMNIECIVHYCVHLLWHKQSELRCTSSEEMQHLTSTVQHITVKYCTGLLYYPGQYNTVQYSELSLCND